MPCSPCMGTSTLHPSLGQCIPPHRGEAPRAAPHRRAWPVPSGHLPTAPAGSLALWGCSLPARGSARAGIPHLGHTSTPTSSMAALPRDVPLHGQSLWFGGGSVGGSLPQPRHSRVPQDSTHSQASTPSLQPATTVAPTARCWEEDEEERSASPQGCSRGWLEAAGSCLSTLTRGAAWPSDSAGAGVHPLPRALPAPQPQAARTGWAGRVAVRLGPESRQADSGRSRGVSQREGSDAGGSGAAGLGQLGTVTNAAAKGRVARTPRPALTHAAITLVLWVLLGRGARRAVLQDSKGWVRGWLHGLPANISLLFLFQTGLHAPLQTASHSSQHPSPLSWWRQTECLSWCCSISVHPPAPPCFKFPQSFPPHPFSPNLCQQTCPILPHLHTQTGWIWRSQGPSALPRLWHGQDCAGWSRLVSPCAALWSYLWACSQSVRSSGSSVVQHRDLNACLSLPWVSKGSSFDIPKSQPDAYSKEMPETLHPVPMKITAGLSRAQGLEDAYPRAEGAIGGHLPGGKRVTEPVSQGLYAEVLERASDGDDNRRASPILLGVWSLWCGVLARPAPARGKKKGAGKVEAAGGLGRRMWGVEMDGWQEGWRDREMVGGTEG